MWNLSFVEQAFLTAVGTCALSLLLTPQIRKFALAIGCISKPTHDRWGRRAIGRLGGLAIALGFLGTMAFLIPKDHRLIGLLAASSLMLGTGLWDDVRRMAPFTKLILQIIAGCLVVLSGIQFSIPSFPWASIPLTIGWLVLIMNAFNLMDNMDGLSGGIGTIAAVFCAWSAMQSGAWQTAILSLSLAGATVGFLRYNLPPAKIFMGDSGSQILGLGLGTLPLMESWGPSTSLLAVLAIPTFLLAVPIFDTFFVTISRLTHGRHPFQGGTDHLSHRLGILGLTTRQVVFTLYGISIAFGFLSVTLAHQSPLAIASVWLLSLGLLLIGGVYLGRVRVYTGPAAVSPAETHVTFVETMLLHKRRIAEVLIDFLLICASYVTAHALRFEANLTPDLLSLILKSLPWIILVKMLCFAACGLYQGLWRYTSLPDLVNIFRAVAIGSMLSALSVLYLWRFQGYSRAVFVIDGLLLFVTISGARVAGRLLDDWISASVPAVPVLIIGAGDSGEMLLRQLKQTSQGKRRVIGFLDDDLSLVGNRIHGIPILGSRESLGRIVQEHGVKEVLIAIPRPSANLVQQIQAYCEENSIPWRMAATIPAGESTLAPEA